MPNVDQEKPPNFRGKNGKLYLVRCFACSDSPRGRENYALAVSDGICAWCGWQSDEGRAEPGADS